MAVRSVTFTYKKNVLIYLLSSRSGDFLYSISFGKPIEIGGRSRFHYTSFVNSTFLLPHGPSCFFVKGSFFLHASTFITHSLVSPVIGGANLSLGRRAFFPHWTNTSHCFVDILDTICVVFAALYKRTYI